jgi:hypothetical protein
VAQRFPLACLLHVTSSLTIDMPHAYNVYIYSVTWGGLLLAEDDDVRAFRKASVRRSTTCVYRYIFALKFVLKIAMLLKQLYYILWLRRGDDIAVTRLRLPRLIALCQSSSSSLPSGPWGRARPTEMEENK